MAWKMREELPRAVHAPSKRSPCLTRRGPFCCPASDVRPRRAAAEKEVVDAGTRVPVHVRVGDRGSPGQDVRRDLRRRPRRDHSGARSSLRPTGCPGRASARLRALRLRVLHHHRPDRRRRRDPHARLRRHHQHRARGRRARSATRAPSTASTPRRAASFSASTSRAPTSRRASTSPSRSSTARASTRSTSSAPATRA